MVTWSYALKHIKLSDDCTIIHGDCNDILHTLDFNAIVTDPPYGINFNKGEQKNNSVSYSTKKIHGDDKPFDPSPLIKLCGWKNTPSKKSLEKPLVIFGVNHYLDKLPQGMGTMCCWDKACGQGPKSNFVDGEFFWINRIITRNIFHHMWLGCIREGQDNSGRSKRYHVSQKPVELMMWCMDQARIGLGKVVVDPYMGSASTGIACLQTGRKFVGIEIDEENFESSRVRLQNQIDLINDQLNFQGSNK